MTIAIVGEIPTSVRPTVTFQKVDSDQPATNAHAYWITSESVVSTEQVSVLLSELAAGKVMMFLGDEEPGRIWSLFGVKGNSTLDTVKGNVRQVGFYLWQDAKGQNQAGIIYSVQNAPFDLVLDAVLEQTVNHMGNMNRNQLSTGEKAAPGNHVSMANWTRATEIERNFVLMKGNTYTEWSRYLVVPTDRNSGSTRQYVLSTVENQLAPHHTHWKSDLLKVSWVGGAGLELHQYGPTSQSGTQSIGYTLNVEGLPGGDGGKASYRREWKIDDLEVIDNSDYSIEKYHVTFDYKGGAYSQNVSTQHSAWIVEVTGNEPLKICHGSSVEFSRIFRTDDSMTSLVCDTIL